MSTLQASAGEKDYPALLRAKLLQSKYRVLHYWRDANPKQRAAICYIAELPASFAGPLLPIGQGDRESIRQAVIELGFQHLFHGCMSAYEWHMPGLKTEGLPENTGAADRLERKRNVLKEAQAANSGQKKTPISGATNT
jgi:hypothetical protein